MQHIIFNPGIMKYSDIRPLFAGMSQCRPGHSYGPAIRNHCIIHYCVSGKGVFKNQNGVHHITKGKAFIINQGELAFYQADEKEPWEYIWIAFCGDICDKIMTIEPVVDLSESDVFCTIAHGIEQKILSPEFYLKKLLDLFEILLPIDESSMPDYAIRAKEYIKLHYMEDISVEHIAAAFNIDRRYLLRLFKREFGVTIVNYIVKTRLEAAYEYLVEGYAVNRAAVMCGYSDAYNFSKMFKKYYGYAPSDAHSHSENKITSAQIM